MEVTGKFYDAALIEAKVEDKGLAFGPGQITSEAVGDGYTHYGPGEGVVGKTDISEEGVSVHTFEDGFIVG